MSAGFDLVIGEHKAFGFLVTLVVPGQPSRRLTKQEATILSRALDAVADGNSQERQIFMSPIASDHDFEARVGENGVIVLAEGHQDHALDWDETRSLADELRSFGE